jgi:hypothetical protein
LFSKLSLLIGSFRASSPLQSIKKLANVWWSWDTISVNAELWMPPCCQLIRLIFYLVLYDISVQTMEMLHKTQDMYGISVFYSFVLGRERNYANWC